MVKITLVLFSALLGCTFAEPPSGYSYSGPSASYVLVSGGHGGGHGGGYSGGYISGGHGGYSSGGHNSPLSSGGHYTSVPVGHQGSEGYHIDPHLLDKIKHIILKDEIQNEAYQKALNSHSSHGHGHGVSSHYGAPAPVYGPPHYQDRIVGIELEHIQQGLQVAQYHQAEEDYSSGGYEYPSSGAGYSSGLSGYSSGHGSDGGHASISYSAPSISHSAPSITYTTIGVPSGSYGVPSSSYGSPHHH